MKKIRSIEHHRDNNDWNSASDRDIYSVNDVNNNIMLYEGILNEIEKVKTSNKIQAHNDMDENNNESGVNDENTDKEFTKIDIGSKKFDITCRLENNFNKFTNAKYDEVAIVHFKRKSCDKLMTDEEIEEYFDNGNFKQSVTPSILHKIAKSMLRDFYFIISGNSSIIVSPHTMQNIYKNNAKIELNSTIHVEKVLDKDGNKIISNNKNDLNIDWFSQNIDCPSPYAYTDRIMLEEKSYDYKIKQKNGQIKKVHAQRSNELADKSLSVNNIDRETDFLNRIKEAFDNSEKKNEDQVLVFPYTDRKNHHMLDVVVAIKDGKPNITIINSNSLDVNDAITTYGLSIANTFQRALEVCMPDKASEASYFFYQNRTKDGKPTQVGGTCVTHGLYNAKKIIKDKKFEESGQNVHWLEILMEAEQRGMETLLRDVAKEQNKFIQKQTHKKTSCYKTSCYSKIDSFGRRFKKKNIESKINFDKKKRDDAIYAYRKHNNNTNKSHKYARNMQETTRIFTDNRNRFVNKNKCTKCNEQKYNNNKKNSISYVNKNSSFRSNYHSKIIPKH